MSTESAALTRFYDLKKKVARELKLHVSDAIVLKSLESVFHDKVAESFAKSTKKCSAADIAATISAYHEVEEQRKFRRKTKAKMH